MNLTVIITAAIICATVVICFCISARYDCQLAELRKKHEALRHTILHLECLANNLDVEENSQITEDWQIKFDLLREQIRNIYAYMS